MHPEPVFARDIVSWIHARIAHGATGDALARAFGPDTWLASSVVLARAPGAPSTPLHAWIDALPRHGVVDARLADARMNPQCVVVLYEDETARAYQQHWERIDGAKAAPWFIGQLIEQGPCAIPPLGPSVSEAREALHHALASILSVGKRYDLEHWGDYFATALALLENAGDCAIAGARHPASCRLPPGIPADAHALAHAAEASDAFGGMGSWNDFYLVDRRGEAQRQDASALLSRAIDDALVAVAHCDLTPARSSYAPRCPC
jgi:hypothetical protein